MWGSGAVWSVLRRPRLWGEAVRTVGALAPRGWWRRAPYLPKPDPSYLEWRRETAYGSAAEAMTGEDVVAYLEWRRRFRAVQKGAALG